MRVRKAEMLALMEQVANLQEELTVNQLRIEDQDWVALQPDSSKDINRYDYVENHNTVYAAYRSQPLAKRIVRFMTQFSMGGGLHYTCDDDDVRQVVDGFWNDDQNQMGLFIRQMVEELSVYGEIFVRFFYNEVTGHTQVACIDPSEIVHVETNKDNVRDVFKYWRRYRELDGQPTVSSDGSVHFNYKWSLEEIPRLRDDGLLNVQHIKVNSMSNTTRGVSDLLDIVKWVDRYESWLTDRVLLNKIRNLFHYDVTINNGNAKDVKAYLAGLKGKAVDPGATTFEAATTSTIRPAAIRVHTDKIKWDVVQPKIDASDAKEDGRAIKLMIAAGAGLPEHWLGDSGNANLATAKAMDLPTLKQFEDRQELLRMEFETMLHQVVLCQRRYGALPTIPESGSDTFEDGVVVEFAPLEDEDLQQLSAAFKQVTDAVNALANGRFISKDTANKILAKYEPLVGEWEGEGGEREKIGEENPEDRQVQGRVAPAGSQPAS